MGHEVVERSAPGVHRLSRSRPRRREEVAPKEVLAVSRHWPVQDDAVTNWLILTGPLGPHAILPGVGSVFLGPDSLEVFGLAIVPRAVMDELYRLEGER